MQRLGDLELYSDGKNAWLVTNIWDEVESCFFQELFVRTDPVSEPWSRVGAYFIDDEPARKEICSSIAGKPISSKIGNLSLPVPIRPVTHNRTIDIAVHARAARSAPKWLGKLSKMLSPR
ncbi:hypothetical protein GCM10025778_07690 [Paeniglutamicibacter antarcticus]|uniref:LysR substrate binding domain-containing protein n=1 Tax=Paeniglutamicibacter antarcticus TaxID=494023 RepID=A0ABP9TK50_9MICC